MAVLSVVNEGSTAYLEISFYDKDNNAATPSTVTYRIDDLNSGAEIRADTSVSPASSVEITLTPDDNKILDTTSAYEKRLVTIKTTFGTDDGMNEEYTYLVKNLAGVS